MLFLSSYLTKFCSFYFIGIIHTFILPFIYSFIQLSFELQTINSIALFLNLPIAYTIAILFFISSSMLSNYDQNWNTFWALTLLCCLLLLFLHISNGTKFLWNRISRRCDTINILQLNTSIIFIFVINSSVNISSASWPCSDSLAFECDTDHFLLFVSNLLCFCLT